MTIIIGWYIGRDIAVRQINKRGGAIAFGLHRPDDRNGIIDEFPDLAFANNVAFYIDSHGGSYGSEERKAAKEYAKGMEDGKN